MDIGGPLGPGMSRLPLVHYEIAELGTTDDCGFASFADDTSTARDIGFGKIQSRVEGTEVTARKLGFNEGGR